MYIIFQPKTHIQIGFRINKTYFWPTLGWSQTTSKGFSHVSWWVAHGQTWCRECLWDSSLFGVKTMGFRMVFPWRRWVFNGFPVDFPCKAHLSPWGAHSVLPAGLPLVPEAVGHWFCLCFVKGKYQTIPGCVFFHIFITLSFIKHFSSFVSVVHVIFFRRMQMETAF